MKKIVLISTIIGCVVSLSANPSLNTCMGCHGKNFEKVALGKSKIVKNMTKDEIKIALDGYKDETYGGPMKGIMKGQVKSMNDTEQMAVDIYSINNTSTIDKTTKPRKKECLEKVIEIEKCITSEKSKEDLKRCKILIEDLNEFVKNK